MSFSSARRAAGAVAFIAFAGLAGAVGSTAAQAQQTHKPVAVQRAAPPQHAPPRVFTPRPTPQFHVNSRPVNVAPTFTPRSGGGTFHAVTPHIQRVNPNAQINNSNLQRLNPNLAQPKGVPPLQGANALQRGPGNAAFSPVQLRPGFSGGRQVRPAFPAINVNNRFWPILKGPKFVWFGGHRRFFVPVGLLGVALIGGSYWYPDGYVSIAGPACAGFTPDGCQLQWRMVDFEDGGAEPQCVQYCPQVGPPPAAAAPLPPPPAFAANGTCQLTIFSEPHFAGLSAPTGDSQAELSQAGWRNEIASLQVQAGTWDFFSEENFGGESMRLPAGPYPTLPPEWNKRIGSFMCVQPGAPGA